MLSLAFVAGAMCLVHVSAAESGSFGRVSAKPSRYLQESFVTEMRKEMMPNASDLNVETEQRSAGDAGDSWFSAGSMYYDSPSAVEMRNQSTDSYRELEQQATASGTTEVHENVENTSTTEEANRDLGKKHGGGGGVGSSWYGASPMFYGPAPMYAAPMYSNQMYSTPMWGNSWGGRFLAEEMPTPEEMEVRDERVQANEEADRDLGKKHGGNGGVGSSWYGASPMFYGPAPMYAAPMYSNQMYSTPMWGNSWGGRFLAEEMPTPEEMEVRAEIAAIPLSLFEQRLLKKKSRGSDALGAASWGPSYSSYGPSYYAPSYYSYPQQSYPMYGSMSGYRRFLARGDTSADILSQMQTMRNKAEKSGVPRNLQSMGMGYSHHHHHGPGMGMGGGYGNRFGPNRYGMYGNGFGNGGLLGGLARFLEQDELANI